MEKKTCPRCGSELVLAHKTARGIIEYNISDTKPVNVWACHDPCWHDEPYIKEKNKENADDNRK